MDENSIDFDTVWNTSFIFLTLFYSRPTYRRSPASPSPGPRFHQGGGRCVLRVPGEGQPPSWHGHLVT